MYPRRFGLGTNYNTRPRMATRERRNGMPVIDLILGFDMCSLGSVFSFDTYFTNCYVLCGSAFWASGVFPFTIHTEKSVL